MARVLNSEDIAAAGGALNGHSHLIENITGLQTALDAKQIAGSYANASHTHIISEVTGLQTALDAKLSASGYTAADILAKLLTVDGGDSGLDADLLDGQSSSHYLAWANLTGIPSTFAPTSHNHAISEVTGLQASLDSKLAASGYTAADILSKLLTVDGIGSGLDAALLEGNTAAQLRSYANLTGVPSTFTPSVHVHTIANITDLQGELDIRIKTVNGVGPDVSGNVTVSGGGSSETAAELLAKIKTVDGVASGLDADLVDGQHGTYYLDWINFTNVPSTFTPTSHSHVIADTTGLQTALDGKQAAGSYAAAVHDHAISEVTGLQAALDTKLASSAYTAADVLAKVKTLDGPASGLDSDLLDGQEGNYYLDWANFINKPTTFAPSGHNHTISEVTGLQTQLDLRVKTVNGTAPDGAGNVVVVASSVSSVDIMSYNFIYGR